jgi:hypothetical protein
MAVPGVLAHLENPVDPEALVDPEVLVDPQGLIYPQALIDQQLRFRLMQP